MTKTAAAVDVPAFIDAALPQQLVNLFNELCAAAHDLGLARVGGRRIAEVTRFSTTDTARRRCLALHLEVERARAFVAAEDAGARASGTIKELPAERPPARRPRFTMTSVVRPLDANPYEEGTKMHGIFASLRRGMTVGEFCADHGTYPRALNYLNPMIRDGAVEVVAP